MEGITVGQKPTEAAPPPPPPPPPAGMYSPFSHGYLAYFSLVPAQTSSSSTSQASAQASTSSTLQVPYPPSGSVPQPGLRPLAMHPGLLYTTYPTLPTTSNTTHFPYGNTPYAFTYHHAFGTSYTPSRTVAVGTLPYGATQPAYHQHLYSYTQYANSANYYV